MKDFAKPSEVQINFCETFKFLIEYNSQQTHKQSSQQFSKGKSIFQINQTEHKRANKMPNHDKKIKAILKSQSHFKKKTLGKRSYDFRLKKHLRLCELSRQLRTDSGDLTTKDSDESKSASNILTSPYQSQLNSPQCTYQVNNQNATLINHNKSTIDINSNKEQKQEILQAPNHLNSTAEQKQEENDNSEPLSGLHQYNLTRIEYMPNLTTSLQIENGERVSMRKHINDIIQNYDIIQVPSTFLPGLKLPSDGRFFIVEPENCDAFWVKQQDKYQSNNLANLIHHRIQQ